ncbi:MAG TPA: hypothetical protein VE422_00270 [Terriglobia bacterium]|nr:hypothetical protein [Terriglobia bacterium]
MISRFWFLVSVLWTGFFAAVIIDGMVDPSTKMPSGKSGKQSASGR